MTPTTVPTPSPEPRCTEAQSMDVALRVITQQQAKGGIIHTLARELAPDHVFCRTDQDIDAGGAWHIERGESPHAPVTHVIRLNGHFAHLLGMPFGTPDKQERVATLARDILRHEASHARYTTRDPSIIQRALRAYKIPPYLYNLFEDCRIEQAARDEDGVPFRHLESLASAVRPTELASAYFQLVSMANGDDALVQCYYERGSEEITWRGYTDTKAGWVKWFNDRAAVAPSTFSLWPILVEFLEVFGGAAEQDEEGPASDDGKGKPGAKGDGDTDDEKTKPQAGKKGDLKDEGDERVAVGKPEDTATDGSDPEDGEKSDSEHEDDEGGGTDPDDGEEGSDHHGTRVADTKDASFRLDPFNRAPDAAHRAPNLEDAPRIARKLGELITARDSARDENTTSGAHLNMRGAMVGAEDSFRQHIDRTGRRRICALFDMSGSMCTDFKEHGGAFMAALCLLRQRGTVDCDIWLTGAGYYYKVPESAGLEFVSDLYACLGTETVAVTLEKARRDVEAADTVIIYTDGDLTDGDVNCAVWRARGVDLIGVKVGDDHSLATHRRELIHHFGKGLVAPSGVELAAKICQYVLRQEATQ